MKYILLDHNCNLQSVDRFTLDRKGDVKVDLPLEKPLVENVADFQEAMGDIRTLLLLKTRR